MMRCYTSGVVTLASRMVKAKACLERRANTDLFVNFSGEVLSGSFDLALCLLRLFSALLYLLVEG